MDAGWPEWLIPEAERVIHCESSGNPEAVGDRGASLGLFQLNRLWFRYAGEDVELWADPRVNARAALAVIGYQEARGRWRWGQWTCQP